MRRNMIISFLPPDLIFQDIITFPELFPSITGMLSYIRKNLIKEKFSYNPYNLNLPFKFNTESIINRFFNFPGKVEYIFSGRFSIVYQNQCLLIMNTGISFPFSLPSALINKPA